MRLRGVSNKPSYGKDEISYADLILLARWTEGPLAKIFDALIKL